METSYFHFGSTNKSMAKMPLDYPITIIWSFKIHMQTKTIDHVIKKEKKF